MARHERSTSEYEAYKSSRPSLTVDDAHSRRRSSSRHRSRSRSRARDSSQQPHASRSRSREVRRERSPQPPQKEETTERSGYYAGSSAASGAKKKKGGEKVYTAPEPPAAYQPPAYVDSPIANVAPGVLPGLTPGQVPLSSGYGGGSPTKPAKHAHSQSAGYSSGKYGEEGSYTSDSARRKAKKKNRYSEADLAYGEYSDDSAHSIPEGKKKPYSRPLDPAQYEYVFGKPSSSAGSKPSKVGAPPPPPPPPKVPLGSSTPASSSPAPLPNPFLYQTSGPVVSPPAASYASTPTSTGYNPTPVPQVTTGGPIPTTMATAGGAASTTTTSATYGHVKTSSLSVPGVPPAGLGIQTSAPGQPVPSPALQPYHGTYQSISPMPSPIFAASPSGSYLSTSPPTSALGGFSLGPPAYPSSIPSSLPYPDDFGSNPSLSDIVYANPPSPSASSISVRPSSPPYPLYPDSPSSSERHHRRSSYNPTPDAKAILSELRSTFSRPSPRPIINILPTLTPSELSLLRREYKHQYRGVNLAKHIKAVFPTTTPFGKLAFSLALGPYESEAWFANSWYQKRETRNELLIEALMGRTNAEIAKIKSAFRDAKYESSLEKAVTTELPRDKFRYAVMLQLAGVRMEEEVEVEVAGVREDVARLGNILERRTQGGETEMIDIIVNRSNNWLRAVVEKYRLVYERDLLKAVLKRSSNLVGELLLHVLAGATNAPLRDAKLMEQAIRAAIEAKREDLLISRATRVHWDRKHLKLVKNAFRKRYGVEMGERIRTATRGSYQELLIRMLREER